MAIDTQFLSYYKDKNDLIYASLGSEHPLGAINTTLVYIPTSNPNAPFYQQSSNTHYIKRIIEGYSKKTDWADLDPTIRQIILQRVSINTANQRKCILLPLSEIVEMYNPKQAFQEVLKDKKSMKAACLRKTMPLFEMVGIPDNSFGVYGGLQVDIERVGRQFEHMSDIDLLIFGLENLEKLRHIDNYLPHFGYRKQNIKHLKGWSNAEYTALKRRKSVLDFCTNDGFMVDIKFCRLPKDLNHYYYNTDREEFIKTKKIVGIVTNDLEATSLPCVYQVKAKEGTIYTISTPLFHYLGASWRGDTVEVVGKLYKDNNLVIVDKNHYINTLSDY